MKKIIVALFLFFAVLGTSWSLLNSGFFRVHDYTHAARISEMLRALQDGQFPVRWTSNFGYGYGMPLFEFYAPLPYYVGTLFYWLGIDIITSIKLLFILCSAVTFIGMYKLGARLYGRAGGILSAMALTFAPYRAVNLFVRGAISEAWGIMAIPWVLLGIVKVIKKDKGGWINLFFGLFLLFLSHNLTTLIFLPISILFAGVYWLSENYRKIEGLEKFRKVDFFAGVKLFFTYVLAVGLCSFYLFPAFLEKDYTKVNAIFGGYFYYGNHFLYLRQFFEDKWGYGGSAPWPFNGISFFLGYGQWFGFAVTTILLVRAIYIMWKKKSKKKNAKLLSHFAVFYLLCFLSMSIALFMTLFKSKFIWDHIALLAVVQFPWRWLSVAIVFLALIVGMATLFLPRVLRYIYVILLSVFLLATNAYFFRPEKYLDDPVAFYYTDPAQIRSIMSGVLNDYIPKQMPEVPAVVDQPVTNFDLKNKEVATQISVLVNRSQEKLLQTNFSSSQKVEFSIGDFPGWTTYIDDKEVPKEEGKIGNVAVTVPAGSHLVGVQLKDTPIRFWSDLVSAASLVVLMFLLVEVRPQNLRKKI